MAVHTALLHRLDVVVYAFELPLITGAVREGLLVCVNGTRWGEIAPYPGRSGETLKEALQQTLDYFAGAREEELFPSVQFGLESALDTTPFAPVQAPLYALLSGNEEAEILEQAGRAASEGYRTVKVKLSPFSVSRARGLLQTLQKGFRLRIDCNSAYSMDEALSLFSPFDPADFEYIEDPTYEIQRLHEFAYPLALDETVTQYRTLPLATYPNLYGFILKPTLLGGRKGCAAYVAFAKEHNLKVVFSPAFESGVGLLQILLLARHFGLLTEPLGLDTHRHLQYDLFASPVNFNTPHVCVDRVPQINTSLLTQVYATTSLPHR